MGVMQAPWFVVLPDQDLSPGFLGRVRNLAGPDPSRVVSHASGRPWLVGRWSDDEMTVCAAGEVRLAVAGVCSLDAAQLSLRAMTIRATADIAAALSGAYGSFHVLASVAGSSYVRGSLSGKRRVYRTEVDGVTVCADQAHVLARLTGAGVDTAQLALRLAGVTVPHPLADSASWCGVGAVPPAEAVELKPGGVARVLRWWQAPAAELPLREAAAGLREALRRAVALRVRPGDVVAADLSGGMDSTSLCFLAAEAGARLVTMTLHWSAPTNEDHAYAALAARRLPLVEHLVFPAGDLPACFAGLDERTDPGDGPSPVKRDRLIQQQLAEEMGARGTRLRLSGHGGDHVVQPPAAYVHGLLRSSPVAGVRHAAGLCARSRQPLGAAAKALLDRRSYASWLARAAGLLRVPAPLMDFGWGVRPQLPFWASEQAVESCQEQLRTAARDAVPLHHERSRHAWIAAVQQAGLGDAHFSHDAALAGLPLHTPFCDDAVVEAALAARPHEAASPWSYKPLLAAAMDGLVPGPVVRRTTKDHCMPEWQEGLRRQRRTLAAWAEDSRLVAAGVADEAKLRRALLSPALLSGGVSELEATLAAEAWLRDVEHDTTLNRSRELNDAPTAR
ncbi:asparagine synthase-related protein [Streptomyces sp. S.PB5]|uniref:asparagine synthase-related protein n=1 Tax=Streptomyces sp. S.PB5 TaxID=3020844 RepID=UPI0025B1EB26|nr:asparagine synthase-related protein [Streptomyces sp. S.PB5]MDN3025987.1 asparagine synthase-related protein [Streptomyces sp. S.PB5]